MGEIKNIYLKMLSITNDAQAIEKMGHNDYSKYKYIRAVDVIAEIQKLLIKHKVSLSITELECTRTKEEKNFHTKIKCKATFTNVEAPSEKIEVDYYAISSDTLDKDIFKAKTNGLKYLLTQQFMIVTDLLIDTEEEKKVKEPTPKIDDKKENEKMTQWLVKNGYDAVGIESVYNKQLNNFTEDDRVRLRKEVEIYKISK